MHTCAALSTAQGKGGIAVIRLSGDDCFEIADKVFKTSSGKRLCELEAKKMVFGNIFGSDGRKIDEGLCVCFHAPHSFTGENTVEISCHGSPVGTSLILSALFRNGAEPAIAGEFTKRAFVNGKLDLTQSEAVGQLIDAQSSAALMVSVNQLDGGIGRKIKEASDKISLLLASVYAFIDYPDEDMTDISKEELQSQLREIYDELYSLSSTYSTGSAICDGIPAAIVGSPNTGKSSLLNMLLGFDRAIVTDVAGTTRDVVTHDAVIGNIRLALSDTAGIRDTNDVVEKIGVEKSVEELKSSGIIFAVFDVSRKIDDEALEICDMLEKVRENKTVIIIINKCDLSDEAPMRKYFADKGYENIASVSAKNKTGKENIEKILADIFPDSQNLENANIVSNARQYASLKRACDDVKSALSALENLTEDTACLDMESALGELLEADGRKVSEEIVNNIFSHFCVGK